MKRFISFILVVLILVTFAIPTLAEYVKVQSGSWLNVRETPNGKGIGKLFRNNEVYVTGIEIDIKDREWAEIRWRDGTAYVLAEYLSESKLSGHTGKNTLVESELVTHGIANGNTKLNIRSGPGYDFPIIDSFKNGTSFDVIAHVLRHAAGWYKIPYDNEAGFAYVRATLVILQVN